MVAVFHRFLYYPLLYYTVFFCYCMSVCAAFSECVEKDFAHTSLQKSRPSVSAFLSAVQLKPTKTVSVCVCVFVWGGGEGEFLLQFSKTRPFSISLSLSLFLSFPFLSFSFDS